MSLDDFFAAEYDGDDQRLEVAPARRSTVRLTRRGRLVVLGLGLAATLGLGLYAASVSTASDHPEQTRMVTVQPGQTLWDISSRAAPGDGDVRSMMSHLEAINHLDSGSLQVGQHLRGRPVGVETHELPQAASTPAWRRAGEDGGSVDPMRAALPLVPARSLCGRLDSRRLSGRRAAVRTSGPTRCRRWPRP